RLVKPGGLYAIAIYTKTPLCQLWKIEKRIYKISPRLVQRLWRYVYMGAFLAFLPATNYDPIGFVRNYRKSRGMNFSTDAHDWLGGYPYESATAEEIHAKLRSLGMVNARSFEIEPGSGIWGVGCSEYVYLQSQPPAIE